MPDDGFEGIDTDIAAFLGERPARYKVPKRYTPCRKYPAMPREKFSNTSCGASSPTEPRPPQKCMSLDVTAGRPSLADGSPRQRPASLLTRARPRPPGQPRPGWQPVRLVRWAAS
ncbi:hypothetical protein [Nocardia carnea]|uniref:Uncharacterized protein n=1 Tax=Nocardia carnea TaxID=37328 RepID=A0ABW7TFG8_9NOCA